MRTRSGRAVSDVVMASCYARGRACASGHGTSGHRCQNAAQPARSPRTTLSSGGVLTLAFSMVLKDAAETGRAK